MQLSFSNMIHSDLKSQKYNQTLKCLILSSSPVAVGTNDHLFSHVFGSLHGFHSFFTESRLCLISLSLPMSSHFQNHHKSNSQYFAQLLKKFRNNILLEPSFRALIQNSAQLFKTGWLRLVCDGF